MDDPKHLLDLATGLFDPPERLEDVRARFHRRRRSRRVVAATVALAVAGAGIAFAATQFSNRPTLSMGNPAGATCPAEPASTTITITITTLPTKTQFDSGCYAAVANQPLTVIFVNRTTTLSGRSMWLSVSVYPSPASADTVSPDGGEVRVNRANAIATSSEVSSGSQTEFSLPALPAGTYWIQSDDVAPIMHAQLMVAERPASISAVPKSASEILGGIGEPDFASAEAAVRNPILRPSSCAANDDTMSELMVNPQTQEVYVRYKTVTDPQCSGYLGGSVVVREWPNGGPSDPASLHDAMARRAVAMGRGATLTTIAGVPAIVQAGDYPGDCNESPAPGQEGCAPAQDNPAGVIMQIGRTMIEVMGSGRWSDEEIESVARTIHGA